MASIPLLRLSSTTTFTHHKPPLSLLHHPLKPPSFPIKPLKTLKPLKQKPTIIISATTPAPDRLMSSISYFLPFFNGLHYGRYLFSQFPPLALAFQPLLPLFYLYKSIPYASFVSFFAIYLGVVRNPSFSHYVRFNAMQALVLDVLLVLPLILQRIFTPGNSGLPFKLLVMGHNFLFVFVVACFLYALLASVFGRTPFLPFVADAAARQL